MDNTAVPARWPWIALAIEAAMAAQSFVLLKFRPLATTPEDDKDMLSAEATRCRFGPDRILLLYRAAVTAYMVAFTLQQFVNVGFSLLKFYTIWNWYLLVAYFVLVTTLSATAALRRNGKDERQTAGGAERTAQAMLHVNLTTVLIVDVVHWFVLWPMASRDPDPDKVAFFRAYYFNYDSYVQHGLNLLIIYVELFLNVMPLQVYMLGYASAWSTLYGFYSIVYHHYTGVWLYPILDAFAPWAALSYTGLFVVHWLFYILGPMLCGRLLRGQRPLLRAAATAVPKADRAASLDMGRRASGMLRGFSGDYVVDEDEITELQESDSDGAAETQDRRRNKGNKALVKGRKGE